MFIEVVRQHLEALPAEQGGWLAGLRDPFVGKALSLMHGAPALNWTIEKLAKDVGLSRSVLAQRFAHLVGMPPIQYLAKWRMQIASGLLSDGSANVATVAAEIGYASEAAFSRAFKKLVGISPRIGVAASRMMARVRCCEPSDHLSRILGGYNEPRRGIDVTPTESLSCSLSGFDRCPVCPLRVISGHTDKSAPCPLYPP
jgi:AraC-like DNA-binding protein